MNQTTTKIDLSYINRITGSDEKEVNEFLKILLEQIDEFLNNFISLYNDKDWKNLSILAHKAKTTVLTFGLEELSIDYLKRLEFYSKYFRLNEIINTRHNTEKEQLESQTKCYFEENNIDKSLLDKQQIDLLITDINKELKKIKKEVTSLIK